MPGAQALVEEIKECHYSSYIEYAVTTEGAEVQNEEKKLEIIEKEGDIWSNGFYCSDDDDDDDSGGDDNDDDDESCVLYRSKVEDDVQRVHNERVEKEGGDSIKKSGGKGGYKKNEDEEGGVRIGIFSNDQTDRADKERCKSEGEMRSIVSLQMRVAVGELMYMHSHFLYIIILYIYTYIYICIHIIYDHIIYFMYMYMYI
jgi:hypothetical protein